MTIDFEALILKSTNPYVVVDRELRITWMNDAYLRTTMRERRDLIGVPMFDAFPTDHLSDSYRLLHSSFERVLATRKPDELALIRYDIVNADGGMEVRYWSATHTPLLDDDGEVTHILQHTVDVTELHGLRAMRDEMSVVQRASAVQARNLDLSEESQQLKSLFEQAPGFVAILVGPDHRFQMANQAYRRLVGQRDLIGRTLAEALPEVVEQGFVDLLNRVQQTGTAYIGRQEKVLLQNEILGESEERFLDFIYQPIFDDDDQVTGVFVQGHDVTEQVESEERQKLLINELNHRVKNTLAIVQGLAMQSFRHVDQSEGARQTFDARLHALASAHSLLTEQNWESAALSTMIRSSVEATAGSDIQRVRLEGPDLMLGPQTAVSLAMMIHELTTNAIKYGALSSASGSIDVRWTVDEDEGRCLLNLEWVEMDGPPVEEPRRRGFGTRLIQRGMSSELHGDVDMRFEPTGLRCNIRARLPVSR